MNGHKCPAKCHACPLLDGDIMPMCMGTAAMAVGPNDRSRCTCREEAKDRRRDIDSIGATVRTLLQRVRDLEDRLKTLPAPPVEEGKPE